MKFLIASSFCANIHGVGLIEAVIGFSSFSGKTKMKHYTPLGADYCNDSHMVQKLWKDEIYDTQHCFGVQNMLNMKLIHYRNWYGIFQIMCEVFV